MRGLPVCRTVQLGQLRRAFGSIPLFLILNLEQQCEQLVRQFLGRFVLLFQSIADLLLNLSVRRRRAIPAALNMGLLVMTSHRRLPSRPPVQFVNKAALTLFRELGKLGPPPNKFGPKGSELGPTLGGTI